ncbi:phage integrase SAM-like domain and Arm DNA-binding domain-containing protein [Chryseobacterium taklimakanense]|uniref:phage integrase SAM-like domain-containing protein n=1 Tax=Chryseobacterium taklimakanense TaxID=536441 RepID=UPI001EF5A0F5|nr:phage integrase SAM-like domain-containing protein [Chryseobacterium taklimakanense]MCG7280223.1 phage integrase SAM-like domain and Arm DNA-binding domain-containing protein [Chryseobacterium taklimakanense]
MATLKFILKTQQEDKSGKCPLYIRLIKDRKAKFISTGIKLEAHHWDEDKQKVKKNYPNSTRMNAVLASKLADASIQVLDEERKTKNVTAKKLKQALLGSSSVNFFEYADKTLKNIRETISENTYTVYRAQVNKFKEFVGTDELLLEDMTVVLIKEYIHYSTNVLKNNLNNNVISKGFKVTLVDRKSLFLTAVNYTIIRLNLPTLKVSYILHLH